VTATTTDSRPRPPEVPPQEPHSDHEPSPSSGGERVGAPALVIGLVGLLLTAYLIGNLFLAFSYYPQWFANSKLLIGLVALVAGVGGAVLFFHFLNMFVEALPGRLSRGLLPYAFLLPAIALIGLLLVYPLVQTINYSFANNDSTAYVGLDNYQTVLGSSDFWSAILNNVLWLILVPAATVAMGIAVAVLTDRLSPTGEKVGKSIIFLPMAISFVGAAAIWRLIYNFQPGEDQNGLLNAIWVGLGGSPQDWLSISDARLNSVLMMVILVWLQTGFAMILLSSAIKGVPEDTLEAARIDGANEWQIFSRIVMPQVKGTVITVFITVVILVLKVFDIVFVLTNGRNESDVIANLFFRELFTTQRSGVASAIVVLLLVAIIPVLIYQVRHFRAEERNS